MPLCRDHLLWSACYITRFDHWPTAWPYQPKPDLLAPAAKLTVKLVKLHMQTLNHIADYANLKKIVTPFQRLIPIKILIRALELIMSRVAQSSCFQSQPEYPHYTVNLTGGKGQGLWFMPRHNVLTLTGGLRFLLDLKVHC